LEYQENQFVVFQTEIHGAHIRAFVEHSRRVLDTSQTVAEITELCRKQGINILYGDAFPGEQANENALLEVHKKCKTRE
jgi:hypothetical protein